MSGRRWISWRGSWRCALTAAAGSTACSVRLPRSGRNSVARRGRGLGSSRMRTAIRRPVEARPVREGSRERPGVTAWWDEASALHKARAAMTRDGAKGRAAAAAWAAAGRFRERTDHHSRGVTVPDWGAVRESTTPSSIPGRGRTLRGETVGVERSRARASRSAREPRATGKRWCGSSRRRRRSRTGTSGFDA